jgi:uncharacterized membrane protein YqaE (UPF0057 family)
MRYLLAILCPPVAVLLCGRPITALLNVLLCIAGWLPGVIHACLVVGQRHGDVRAKKTAKIMGAAIDRQTATLEAVATAQAARERQVRR